MILTCPQCKTKFSVPTTALGEEGRKVRCTLCENTWFQTPSGSKPAEDDFSASDDFSDVLDDINAEELNENTAPQDEDALLSDEDTGEDEDDFPQMLKSSIDAEDEGSDSMPSVRLSQGHVAGVAGSAAICVFVFILMLALKAPMITAWPALNGFYGLFGAQMPPKGRNVVFNNLSAEIVDDQITLRGDLVNLSAHETVVLPMLARQIDDHQNVVKQWVIMPPVDHLPAGGVTAFESIYEAAENAHSLNVGFTLEDMVAVSTHDEHKDHSGHDDVEDPHGDEAEHGKETHGHEDAHEAEKSHHSDDHHGTPKAKQEHSPAQTDHHNSHGH